MPVDIATIADTKYTISTELTHTLPSSDFSEMEIVCSL